MKEVIPKDKYGIFADTKDTARVDSLFVATAFGKNHKEVLRDIQKITERKSALSETEFIDKNFVRSSYKDSTGRTLPRYCLTFDGFILLVMGYSGEKAMKIKIAYIKQFNKMTRLIKTVVKAREEFPLLTEQINRLHDHPKPYHYSNECDMLNRLVLGMSAKEFREANGIKKGTSIRPHMTQRQIDELDYLQKLDYGLLLGVSDFQQRKLLLAGSLAFYREKHPEEEIPAIAG